MRENIDTPFVGDPREKVVDNPEITEFCAPDSNGEFSEDTIFDRGAVEEYGWGEIGGCVLRPIEEAWGVLHNLELIRWEEAERFTFEKEFRPSDGIEYKYSIRYELRRIIRIRWTMDWYHVIDRGSSERPDRIFINYQKVAGASQFKHWLGGVVLQRVTDNVTSVAIRNELRTVQSINKDEADAFDATEELFKKIRHGEPALSGKFY